MSDQDHSEPIRRSISWAAAWLAFIGLGVTVPAQAVHVDRPLALTIEVTMTRYQTCQGPHCYSRSEWEDADVPEPFKTTLLLGSSGVAIASFDELADIGLSGPQFGFRWGDSGFELRQTAGDEYCRTSDSGGCSNPFAFDGECEGCEDASFVYLYEEFFADLSYQVALTPGLSWNRWRTEILRTVPTASNIFWDVERLYWECDIENQRYLCSDDAANGHERYTGTFRLTDIRKVPEPGTFMLLGLGLLGLGVSQRRIT